MYNFNIDGKVVNINNIIELSIDNEKICVVQFTEGNKVYKKEIDYALFILILEEFMK